MANVSAKMADALTRHSIDLLRVDASIRKEVVARLNGLERELLRRLRLVDPTAPKAIRFRNTRLVKLLGVTREVFNEVYKDIQNSVMTSMASLAETESTFMTTIINRAVQVNLASKVLDSQTARVLALRSTLIEGAPSKDWWSRQRKDRMFAFERAVREGMVAGEGMDEIARRVRGTRANLYKDGIMATTRRQAQTLVRTSVQAVANEARFQTLQANNDVVKGYQWLATLDSRTCLGGDTLVKSKNGLRKIKEIKKGDLVYGGKSNKLRRVIATNSSERNCLLITFGNGKTIICTEDHLFRTKGGYWVQAKDLQGLFVLTDKQGEWEKISRGNKEYSQKSSTTCNCEQIEQDQRGVSECPKKIWSVLVHDKGSWVLYRVYGCLGSGKETYKKISMFIPKRIQHDKRWGRGSWITKRDTIKSYRKSDDIPCKNTKRENIRKFSSVKASQIEKNERTLARGVWGENETVALLIGVQGQDVEDKQEQVERDIGKNKCCSQKIMGLPKIQEGDVRCSYRPKTLKGILKKGIKINERTLERCGVQGKKSYFNVTSSIKSRVSKKVIEILKRACGIRRDKKEDFGFSKEILGRSGAEKEAKRGYKDSCTEPREVKKIKRSCPQEVGRSCLEEKAVRNTKEPSYKKKNIREDKGRAQKKEKEDIRVTSIEKVGIKPIYDIEVEKDHSFIAEGFIVHNSFICMALDGNAWDLEGNPLPGTGTTTSFMRPPPAHFNCRSTLIPVLKSWEDLVEKQGAGKRVANKLRKAKKPKSTRASMDGQVSEKIDYSEWLKRKDKRNPNFVKEILGPGRYEMWKKNKLPLTQLIDQSWNPLTVEQLRKKVFG